VRPLLQTREYLRRASRVNKRTGNAAIKSTEHYADAKENVERSKQLKRQADVLIESSRQLVDSSKRGSGSTASRRSRARGRRRYWHASRGVSR